MLNINPFVAISLLQKQNELSMEYWNLLEESLLLSPDTITKEEANAGLFPWILSHAIYKNFGYPGLPYSARQYLKQCSSKETKAFMYGANETTNLLLQRANEIVVVDDNEDNLKELQKFSFIGKNNNKLCPKLINSQKAGEISINLNSYDPLAYRSHDEIDNSLCFKNYAQGIEEYQDNYFDLVILSGRARSACFMHSVAKVKIGGYIIVDDIDHPANRCILDMAEELGFTFRKYIGAVPGRSEISKTAFLRRVKKSYSLNDIDLKLEKYIDFKNGFFVEAGGNNGVRQSNSFYFEAMHKWRGMLIEPIPSLAHECRKFRPHAIVEQVALTSPENVPGEVIVHYAGLMSVVEGGMASPEECADHIKIGCEIQALQTYDVKVQTATLSELLVKHAVNKVDLLSLDVEGFELQVLNGIDFSKHAPTYILVEERYPEVKEFLLKNNYELVEKLTHHDYLYRICNDK